MACWPPSEGPLLIRCDDFHKQVFSGVRHPSVLTGFHQAPLFQGREPDTGEAVRGSADFPDTISWNILLSDNTLDKLSGRGPERDADQYGNPPPVRTGC